MMSKKYDVKAHLEELRKQEGRMTAEEIRDSRRDKWVTEEPMITIPKEEANSED